MEWMKRVCEVKHKRVDERIGTIDVSEHGKSIDSLEKYQAQATEQIKNLCDQVQGLVKVLYGFLIRELCKHGRFSLFGTFRTERKGVIEMIRILVDPGHAWNGNPYPDAQKGQKGYRHEGYFPGDVEVGSVFTTRAREAWFLC